MTEEMILSFNDHGTRRLFAIRQMRALPMEKWLERAVKILPQEQTANASPMDLAVRILERGLIALACAEPEISGPLMEDLLRCCSAVDPDTGARTPCSSRAINQQVDDVRTLLQLRAASLRCNMSFVFEEGRRELTLPKESAFRRAAEERTYARTVNVPQVTAALISQGAASLHDLRSTYTYGDALDLLEILNVRNYNYWAGAEAAERKAKRRI